MSTWSDPRVTSGCPSALDLLLDRVSGQPVRTSDGVLLGWLAWLSYEADGGRVTALMVRPRGWRGVVGLGELRIPAGWVRKISHDPPGVVVSEFALGARPRAVARRARRHYS